MPRHCYSVNTGGVRAIVCGSLGEPCHECRSVGGFLCDYPVQHPFKTGGKGKAGKTCDRSMCEAHAHQVGPNKHYCRQHAQAPGAPVGDLFAEAK